MDRRSATPSNPGRQWQTDDPTYAGPRDPSRVDMHDPKEVVWRRSAACAQLKAAIIAVNCVRADQVEAWLAREDRSKWRGPPGCST